MARVLALVSDLMLASRVEGSLRAAGHEVTVAGGVDADAPEPDLIVVDLEGVADLEGMVAVGVPTIGFYSHVEVETRKRATDAGVDLVIPRSRMARELPELAARMLAGPGEVDPE